MGHYYLTYGSQRRETTYLFIPSELCPELYMMFVNLKDTF